MACADGETKLLPTGSSAPSDHPEVSCHASSSSKPRVKPNEVKEVPQPFLKSCVSWPVYPQFPSIRFVVGCFIPSLFHSFFYLCSGQVNVFLFYTLVYMFVLICTCVCVCVWLLAFGPFFMLPNPSISSTSKRTHQFQMLPKHPYQT